MNGTSSEDIQILADFDSLEIATEEMRRMYEREDSRRQALDTKLGTVFAIDALLLAIGRLLSYPQLIGRVIFVLLLISALLSLWAIQARKYQFPVRESKFHELWAQDKRNVAMAKYFEQYRKSFEHNSKLNDKRYAALRWSFNSTAFVVFLYVVAGYWNFVNYSGLL